MGFSGGVLHLFPDPAGNSASGTREDSSDFAPGSVDSSRLAQAAVVQLPSGTVSGAGSPSPPRSVSPPAAEFHAPFLHSVQPSPLDVIRDGYRRQGFSVRAAGFLAQSV